MAKAAKKKREYLVATTKTDFVKKMKETVKSVALTNDQAKELYDVFTAILKDTVISEKRLSLNGVGTFKHGFSDQMLIPAVLLK